jgi:hypothetical protein
LGLLFSGLVMAPVPAGAQAREPALQAAFFRAVGEYFDVPAQEVAIISDWNLSPDEVPVVLFLAQQGGVSPDALIGVRRGGRTWMEVAGRFGVGPQAFHLTLPSNGHLGALTRVYNEFHRRPARDWAQIVLEDSDIVTLVNLRVLSDEAGVPPLEVLRTRETEGSFVEAYFRLISR